VSELFEKKKYNFALLVIEGEGTKLCFSRSGYDKFEDATECVESSIELDWSSMRRL